MAQQEQPVPLESQQPTAAMKYMSVPEKIELTSSGGGGTKMEPSDPPNRYRPMQVPDKITLGATTALAGAREGGEGGGRWEDPGKPAGMEAWRVGHGHRGYPPQQEHAGARPPL